MDNMESVIMEWMKSETESSLPSMGCHDGLKIDEKSVQEDSQVRILYSGGSRNFGRVVSELLKTKFRVLVSMAQ